jgi:hypothetical protein
MQYYDTMERTAGFTRKFSFKKLTLFTDFGQNDRNLHLMNNNASNG